ncbi:hypothetical protein SAMN04488133_3740 [Halobellus limi]|uniref:Uncharacterized protein n=1 Tax=Halobellus limi TaxID=699433 RepID=A0A1H6CVD6_9EURY|nr:hypothetical protein SAMN04488133_3740 [Halobellus limi]
MWSLNGRVVRCHRCVRMAARVGDIGGDHLQLMIAQNSHGTEYHTGENNKRVGRLNPTFVG